MAFSSGTPGREIRTYQTDRGFTTYNQKTRSYSGPGRKPKGAKVKQVPTTVVTTSSDGTVTTSGFGSKKAATRAKRRARASKRRVKAILRSTTREPQTRSEPKAPKPKTYAALPAPKPTSKPTTFQGKPTAGTPTLRSLEVAERAGTLRVNAAGYVTTPKVRRVAGQITRLKAKRSKSAGPLPGLDREQTRVARKVLRRGDKAGATRKEKLAAVETGLVESSFRNLQYGDLDSQGWRQERTSQYGDGPTGANNVKAAADRFYAESISDTGGTRGRGMTAGQLAQTIQASAFPERYDERKPEAVAILNAYERGGLKPTDAKKLRRAKVKARRLGLRMGERKGGGTKKLPGPLDGSRAMVRKIVGAKVRGDKEPGHSTGGDHDPSTPGAYAQDINLPGGNSAEGEPGFTQKTLDRMVGNLRRLGADVPELTLGEDNWEGVVEGYRIQLLTVEHGSGPHIHIGARWEGTPTSSGMTTGGVSYSSSDIAAYAQATGQSVSAVIKALRKRKLTGFQILKRLKRLGAGVGGAAPDAASPPTSDSTLAELERKYGTAVV